MTVVQRETRRRWLLVLGGVAVLGALPAAVAARPTPTPRVDVNTLRDRIRRSAGQPHQGYAESVGRLGLPALPRFDQVTSLLSGVTRMRTWYAARDGWRVDVLDTGQERGLYQTPEGVYSWDFGANRLTYVAPPVPFQVFDRSDDAAAGVGVIAPDQPQVRLPRAADLMPPDLARRLLNVAEGEPIRPLPGRRVAGIVAAGLRITATDPHSTVGHIDIWADPGTGLPVRVELTARGTERPIVVTRFLDVAATAPASGVLVPPTRRDEVEFTTAEASDAADVIFDHGAALGLPDRLGGQPRRDQVPERQVWLPGWDGSMGAFPVNPYGIYGTGLAQFVVLPLSRRIGREVFRRAAAWGQSLTFDTGTAALLSSSLLSLMVVDPAGTRQTYLLAGMVGSERLRQAGSELSGLLS
ncbi:MAG TPA: hypothetical protein VFR67_11140 [Pilimelia sp.]|nr:hypothetical protein [Pilimelia sp.]